MKLLLFLSTFLVILGCSDSNGNSTQKETVKSTQLTCYFFFISDCPASRNNLPKMQRIADRYPSIVKVIGVVSDPFLDETKLDETLSQTGAQFKIVRDTSLQIARKHGATVAPQIILYDGEKQIYSGKLDDYYVKLGKHKYEPTINYVDLAIRSWKEDKQIETPKTKPIGCFINFN